MTELMSGGDAIIRAAIANGVDTVFGIPGAQTYPLFDGIYKAKIDLIVPRHEQSAAYMAMGYAKSSGKTGVFSVVPGPGVLNTTAALCTAMANCTPLVGLTGQVPSSFMGKGRGHLHELTDQTGTLKTLIKDAVHISDPTQTSTTVNQVFRKVRSNRPGPIAVEMCWDTMQAQHEISIEPGNEGRDEPSVDLELIDEAVKILANAAKPMILCGGGAQDANEEVLALAELFNAPVTAFRAGRGVVAEDHPLGVGPVAARELWDDVDVLLAVGSRCEMPYMRWQNYMRYENKPQGGPKLIRIDIDPEQMRIFEPDVGIVADSARACRLLHDKLAGLVAPKPDRLDEISAAKLVAWQLIQKIEPQFSYLQVIREILPRDGIYVPEVSQMGFAVYTGALPILGPRTYVGEGYQGTLGFGFPTALGVKVANPDKAVLSVCGDGGFMFASQELISAAQHNIGLVTLVFNNQAYGNVRRDQQLAYEGRIIGSELQTPDFVKLAESCNVSAYRVRTPAELKPVLARAIENNNPTLIEIVCEQGSETSPWELIHMQHKPSQYGTLASTP